MIHLNSRYRYVIQRRAKSCSWLMICPLFFCQYFHTALSGFLYTVDNIQACMPNSVYILSKQLSLTDVSDPGKNICLHCSSASAGKTWEDAFSFLVAGARPLQKAIHGSCASRNGLKGYGLYWGTCP